MAESALRHQCRSPNRKWTAQHRASGLRANTQRLPLLLPSLFMLSLLRPSAAQSNYSRALNAEKSTLGAWPWSVRGTNFVDAHGNVIRFSGVNWSGLETPRAALDGLDRRNYGSYLDQMLSLGFTVIRLPFAGDTLLSSTYPSSWTISANPDLQGLSSLQIMDHVIYACGQRGIKVILDYHRMHLTDLPEPGAWFDSSTPESVWLNNWGMLAQRYKGNPVIIGVDLFNEVHSGEGLPSGAPYWVYNAGANEAYNYRSATLRAISSIQKYEPNWIIFMEGMWNNYWWGGNCVALLRAPITQPANKLAFSAHDYGPLVYQAPWFYTSNFPNNLNPLHYYRWGMIVERRMGALWVGEFGSTYPPGSDDISYRERTAFEHLVAYMKRVKVSWTYWMWTDDSADTGGILGPDYATPVPEKMALLKQIMYLNFGH